jgi:RNA polymerase sigma-70 factor, ECF subfamily
VIVQTMPVKWRNHRAPRCVSINARAAIESAVAKNPMEQYQPLTPEPASSVDEAALVERARARSPEAWTTIYDRHYRSIFRYVHARVFDRETAEDLASSVFLAGIKGIGSYEHTGRPFLAWLYRIARNVVADHQRRILRRRGLSQVTNSLRGVTHIFRNGDETETPDREDWEPDVLAERLDLHRAVSDLPESQREVVILRFLVGLSTEEICSVTGKERAAVYSLHARAMASLRHRLRPPDEPILGDSGGRSGQIPHSAAISIVRGKKH